MSHAARGGAGHGTAVAETLMDVATFAATVRVTAFTRFSLPVQKTFGIPASSRFTVRLRSEFPSVAWHHFGVLVESVGTLPAALVVERAVHGDGGNERWALGSNALAAAWQPEAGLSHRAPSRAHAGHDGRATVPRLLTARADPHQHGRVVSRFTGFRMTSRHALAMTARTRVYRMRPMSTDITSTASGAQPGASH